MKSFRFTSLLVLLIFFAVSGIPVIKRVSVDRQRITVYPDSCTGSIYVAVENAGQDTLLVGLQISRDSGATWNVPFLSPYFFMRAPGEWEIPFTVQGNHGASCMAKVTVWDSLPVSGRGRRIPAAGHIFLMGSSQGERDEKPVHPVMFSHDFWMDTAEITGELFKQFKPEWIPEFLGLYFYENGYPADNCMYHWAVQYCNWRSRQDGFDTCYSNLPAGSDYYRDWLAVTCDATKNGWRIPTEAEWEYACRGGTTTAYQHGADSGGVGEYAWYKGNFADTIRAVALKRPNNFGLYDMIGGMLEITGDWYDSSYYSASPLLDPKGPATFPSGNLSHDPLRVARGGFFLSPPPYCRPSDRLPVFSSARHPLTFRCVRTEKE